MAELTEAQLLTQNNSLITSQVNPDTITQATLGGHLADIIDSMVNVADLADPTSAIYGIISNLVSTLVSAASTMAGVPGQFAVTIANTLTIGTLGLGEITMIPFLKVSGDGFFDNPGNFTGGKYITPSAGFTGKFQLTDMVFGCVVAPGSGTDVNEIQINKYNSAGVFVSTLASTSFTIDTADTPGTTKYYPSPVETASVTLLPGECVRVDIENSDSGGSVAFEIESIIFNNIAL